jgi:hypothetical protein
LLESQRFIYFFLKKKAVWDFISRLTIIYFKGLNCDYGRDTLNTTKCVRLYSMQATIVVWYCFNYAVLF